MSVICLGGGEAGWVQPRQTDYSSRYDRIAGTANDYNVFTSDLPGKFTPWTVPSQVPSHYTLGKHRFCREVEQMLSWTH